MLRSLVLSVGASLVLPGSGPVAGQTRTTELPEGPGLDAVQTHCAACHPVNRLPRSSGYHREGWAELIATMIDLADRPAVRDEITAYLANHFPPNDRRAPELVSGDSRIAFRQWTAPTLGQRARDPVEAPDGSVWWAGQWGNLVGRLDPATGRMIERPLPTGAMPHSVTPDAAGNIWYTGNQNATIGRIDGRTGAITVYEMPDPAAKDPHTAVFDGDGVLWFTLQQANRVGRLDPRTGDLLIHQSATNRIIRVELGG